MGYYCGVYAQPIWAVMGWAQLMHVPIHREDVWLRPLGVGDNPTVTWPWHLSVKRWRRLIPHHIEFDFELAVVDTIKQRITFWTNSHKLWTIKTHHQNVKHVFFGLSLGHTIYQILAFQAKIQWVRHSLFLFYIKISIFQKKKKKKEKDQDISHHIKLRLEPET